MYALIPISVSKGASFFCYCRFKLFKETSDRGQPRISLEWIFSMWSGVISPFFFIWYPVWKLLTHWRKMLLQLAAETPQLSPLSITHVLSCLEATSHRSDTWFEILTKVQWYEYSSYVYLVDSKTAFRSLLCDQCLSELYWGAWSKLLLQEGHTPRWGLEAQG